MHSHVHQNLMSAFKHGQRYDHRMHLFLVLTMKVPGLPLISMSDERIGRYGSTQLGRDSLLRIILETSRLRNLAIGSRHFFSSKSGLFKSSSSSLPSLSLITLVCGSSRLWF